VGLPGGDQNDYTRVPPPLNVDGGGKRGGGGGGGRAWLLIP